MVRRMPSAQRTTALAAGVLVTATAVLVAQFLSSPSVTATAGERSVRLTGIGRCFGARDVALVASAACAVGVSGTVLLYRPAASTAETGGATAPVAVDGSTDTAASRSADDLLDARRREWDDTADRLADNEAKVYQVVLDADGVVAQSDIVDRTDLSKATVSRTLDSLETRGLVERRRRGMGNTVLLT